MKKFALTTMAALALVLTFTQCKKEAEKPAAEEGVFVTLKATYGQSENRTDFNPNNENNFVWTEGATEYVYVGGSQHEGCMGVLSGTGTGNSAMNFSGYLTMPGNGEFLYFFYLGKGEKKTDDALTTLDFSTQDGTAANMTKNHIAISFGLAFSGILIFEDTFYPISSFAYFDTSDFGTETVSLHGNDVYSKAIVNFSEGTITGIEKGNISIGQGSSGAYVALIPATTSRTTLEFESNTKTSSMDFLRGIRPGKYYCKNDGSALKVEVASQDTPDGAFSVSSTKQVYFSPGNLQYKYDEGFRFAEHQWDVCQDPDNYEWNYTDWVDLFGWGAWTMNEPLSFSDETEYEYNPSNEPTVGGQSNWRTLSSAEWDYLFNGTGRGNNRFLKASISIGGNAHNGVILFPDNYVGGMGYTYNNDDDEYTTVVETDWAAMENAGAVFLPAAGLRQFTMVVYVNEFGSYWSSTPSEDDDGEAYELVFSDGTIGLQPFSYLVGQSVRLVQDKID